MTELMKSEVMTSREIAELTGKRHSDVLVAIRIMEPAWEKISGRKFPLAEYKDEQGKPRPMYSLTKTECLYIATKFNDEARAKLVLRWEELEMKARAEVPTLPSYAEALRQLADKVEENERLQLEAHAQQQKIQAQQDKIEADAPKVLFSDAVATSKRSCLIAELAKILCQNGVHTGQNRLFAWLRDRGYLGKKGEYYNQPTQMAMDMELFEIKKRTINNPDGSIIVSSTTKVTPKGQIYFVNKFLAR